jgi:hypothetical protein
MTDLELFKVLTDQLPIQVQHEEMEFKDGNFEVRLLNNCGQNVSFIFDKNGELKTFVVEG